MTRRRRRRKSARWVARLLTVLLALPALYLAAALTGSLIPVNADWTEPKQGTTVYLADNGIHSDLILPVETEGLDWRPLFPAGDFASVDANSDWIAFGAGDEDVYLNTPSWWDLTPRTAWSAVIGGKRVMHVEYVPGINVEVREIRLRPEEYRRLWTAVRADFALDSRGRPQRIDHPGYGPKDAFYRAVGRASAFRTCNSWVADKLRLAGVKTSLWPPFEQGLLWRYRRENWLRLL
jgi:uncharacterized protein (TIGR02117 family)